jgi:hypothetical protein
VIIQLRRKGKNKKQCIETHFKQFCLPTFFILLATFNADVLVHEDRLLVVFVLFFLFCNQTDLVQQVVLAALQRQRCCSQILVFGRLRCCSQLGPGFFLRCLHLLIHLLAATAFDALGTSDAVFSKSESWSHGMEDLCDS